MSTLEPPAPAKFDDCASTYDALHAESITASGESTDYFARYKLACLQRLGLRSQGAVLDYGCGIGNLTEHLVTSFSDVHAFDPSQKSLEVARRRAPTATFHESANDLPNARFEAVVVAGVLHHVPPRERPGLVAQLRQKLAPGGKLVVFEHNPLNPLTRRAVSACAFDDDAILLWPWEAKRLVASGGFVDTRLDYIVFFPRALAALRPLEPKLAWMWLGAQVMVVGARGDKG
ncbi:MAG TPA: methyltransferase domain-containing protein [Polyangiaceae bacterium]|nr:methyltransferase domain-containing protein [Polyangiaceae bacterium]